MNKNKIGIFCVVFLLLFVVIYQFTKSDKWSYSIEQLNNGDKIVAFGDSLTYGYQLPQEHSYPSQLSEELNNNYKIDNYGINGNTTVDGLNRFQDMITESKPKLIILGLGGNDILKSVGKQKTIENLKQMIAIAKRQNISIVLLPNPEPSVLGVALGFSDYQIFEDISKETETPVLNNVYSKWLSKDKYKIDSIHLNKEGYHNVAKDIAKQLRDNNVVD